MLKQRIITAVILVTLLTFAFNVLSLNSLMLLFIVFIVLAAKEWAKLSLIKTQVLQWCYAFAIGIVTFLVIRYLPTHIQTQLLILASVVWLTIIIYLLFIIKKVNIKKDVSTFWLFFGVLILVTTYIALVKLLVLFDNERSLILMAIAIVWITDSGAYFVGKTLGKHKFSPVVSPGKTWQGVVGGVVLAGVYGYFIAPYYSSIPKLEFILLVVFSAWVSIFGDLFESLLKRQSGYKDSGNILPGHGGILDRVDSLLSFTPVFVIGLMYV